MSRRLRRWSGSRGSPVPSRAGSTCRRSRRGSHERRGSAPVDRTALEAVVGAVPVGAGGLIRGRVAEEALLGASRPKRCPLLTNCAVDLVSARRLGPVDRPAVLEGVEATNAVATNGLVARRQPVDVLSSQRLVVLPNRAVHLERVLLDRHGTGAPAGPGDDPVDRAVLIDTDVGGAGPAKAFFVRDGSAQKARRAAERVVTVVDRAHEIQLSCVQLVR